MEKLTATEKYYVGGTIALTWGWKIGVAKKEGVTLRHQHLTQLCIETIDYRHKAWWNLCLCDGGGGSLQSMNVCPSNFPKKNGHKP